ncbi:MAG: hypothetical protein WCQ00_02900 [bacterium]
MSTLSKTADKTAGKKTAKTSTEKIAEIDLTKVDSSIFEEVQDGETVLEGAVLTDYLKQLVHAYKDCYELTMSMPQVVIDKQNDMIRRLSSSSINVQNALAQEIDELRDQQLNLREEMGWFNRTFRLAMIDAFPELSEVPAAFIRKGYVVTYMTREQFETMRSLEIMDSLDMDGPR